MTVSSSPSDTAAGLDTPVEGSAAHRTRRIPGEEGTWIFIVGDMCVFAVFFSVYLHSRGKAPALFNRSQEMLNRNFGLINTFLLLISSLLVVIAVRAFRVQRQVLASRLFVGAFLCGLGFVVVKAFEYHDKLAAGINPTTNDFFMYYFVLTGLHLFHLIVGMVVLTVLYRFSRRPELTKNQLAFFEGGACFWHMVDLLWLVLFPLLFLVRS